MGSLNRIIAVADTTFRETIRNKILLNMIGFAAAMLAVGWVVSNWSIGEPDKVTMDLGLTIITFAGIVIALFTGIVLVYSEVDKRTILPILAKPVSRWEFILGKFFGFSAAVMLVYAGMNVILILLLAAIGRPPSLQLFQAIYLSAWEVEFIVAMALLFSSFSTPSLSALYTIMIFIAGRFSSDIKLFTDNHPEAASGPLLQAAYMIVPHLSMFNLRKEAVHSLPVSAGDIWLPTLYGVIYITIVLLISTIVFRNRDLA